MTDLHAAPTPAPVPASSPASAAHRAEYIASLAEELAHLAEGPELQSVRACLFLAVDEARRKAAA